MKFYDPDVCLFGGYENSTSTVLGMDAFAKRADPFFVVGDQPQHSCHLQLLAEIPCLQMVLEQPFEAKANAVVTPLLSMEQHADLYELVWTVQPGYFKKRTPEMGNYYGIYLNGGLVAAAGERMKWDDYTEISAVVTDPAHTGKGYASQLMQVVAQQIFQENKIPVLHVTDNNASAIHLHEKLGFRTRRHISLWKFGKITK